MQGKTVLVGVTGGIAAYKTANLVSMLRQAGAETHVMMTAHACEFVAPLTFETLSGNPVIADQFHRETPWEVEHVSLAKKADLIIIAPATADCLAKAAHGIADDFLTTTLVAAKCPVLYAPAMNSAMMENPIVQKNIGILQAYGAQIIEGSAGFLACGDMGKGRMAEPAEIFETAQEILNDKREDLRGIRILITAGPTREAIDTVRFLSNRSSGKMGYALAQAAAARGAEVTLISGPVALEPPRGIEFVRVTTAEEMYQAVTARFAWADIVIKAAAVADYTPKNVIDGKMKKSGDLALELVRTRDILKELGQRKEQQVLVGFAAETDEIETYAKQKLKGKNLDMIVANDVSREDIAFGSEENAVSIYRADGITEQIGKRSKREIADAILTHAAGIRNRKEQ